MSRNTTERLNTDYMFNGCAEFDATNLSFHSISPYICSMNCMFRGCSVRGSAALDRENIKFNHLLRCDDAFLDAGFGFNGTYMQFYGASATIGSTDTYVSSLRGLFSGNKFVGDVAPTIILSKNDTLTTVSKMLTSLDERFADDNTCSSDIYPNGIYDFHSLYSDTSIKSVDMRGICKCLAASSVGIGANKCGTIDFSNMFENCGNLESYEGFIPQYGSTYHAFFNNCSSLSVNLADMFKNYYPSDSNGTYFLSSMETDYSDRWSVDEQYRRNNHNSLSFSTGNNTDKSPYFTLMYWINGSYKPVTFTTDQNIKINFSAFTNLNPLATNRGNWGFYWNAGGSPYKINFPKYDGWVDIGAAVQSAANRYLTFGLYGNIPNNARFWFGNVSIESGDRKIRIGDFKDHSGGGEDLKFTYSFSTTSKGYHAAYNANTALDGYCMSSISYMFNNCNSVYCDNDTFDLVTLVKKTASTLTSMGETPLKHKECFEYAFPAFRIATYSPHYNLKTVRYDINQVSSKYGVVRYCSFNGDSDNNTYGVGTTYMKWLFPNGFLRYGGFFIDDPNYMFYIPYYRVENENGELIDVRPHFSDNEKALTPKGFGGTFNRSAHFTDHDVWLANGDNPFLGGPTIECSIPSHRAYNWLIPSDVLYGAIICDKNGNFVKYAYVAYWGEGVYMNGYHSPCHGLIETTAVKYNPVTIYEGTHTTPIPEFGSVLIESTNVTDNYIANMSRLGMTVISRSKRKVVYSHQLPAAQGKRWWWWGGKF